MQPMAAWFFRNRETGAVTIGQMPNVALWLFILASAAGWLLQPTGRMGSLLETLAEGGLFVWAIDEILRGVNP